MCQEPIILEVHTWRMLKVPDWRFGRQGHPHTFFCCLVYFSRGMLFIWRHLNVKQRIDENYTALFRNEYIVRDQNLNPKAKCILNIRRIGRLGENRDKNLKRIIAMSLSHVYNLKESLYFSFLYLNRHFVSLPLRGITKLSSESHFSGQKTPIAQGCKLYQMTHQNGTL